MMKRDITKKRAFTLIELLVVVAIIGVLAAAVIVSVNDARKKGNYGRALTDMEAIAKAARMYQAENDDYPATDADPSLFPDLPGWPKPPCTGMKYRWFNNGTVKISLVKESARDTDIIYYCVKGDACAVADANPALDKNVKYRTDRTLICR